MKVFTLPIAIAFAFIFFSKPTMAQDSQGDTAKALELVRKNAAVMMLSDDDVQNSYVSSTYTTMDGITMVYLQQAYKEIPVFNQIQVAAFRNDKLVSLTGTRINKLETKINEPDGVPSINPTNAVQKAAIHLNLQPPAELEQLTSTKNNGKVLKFTAAGISQQNITVQALWTPVNDSTVKLSWQVFISPIGSDSVWLVRVDAIDGEVLNKTNLTVSCNWDNTKPHDAVCQDQPQLLNNNFREGDGNITNAINTVNYRVIPFPSESPIHPGGTADIRTNPWAAAAGNATSLTWQSDGTTEYTITRGNNVHAHLDLTNSNTNTGAADTSTTALPNLNFVQMPDYGVVASNRINQRVATTNLFYWNNIMHDISYLYGFDEISGNFQFNNQGRGGLGNDYVQADAQDGGGTNNANFSTPVDGTNPRMQMYLFTFGTPGKDGDLDNGVISHEYTHGISTRLTGGPANSSCLNNAEQMGEGWSDYFALMVTTNWATSTKSDGANSHPIGNYVLNNTATGQGIRNYPYSTDMSINPLTYGSLYSFSTGEPHNIGEIWCAMLWDMTWNIIQIDGINTNLYNPTATGGNSAALKLVLEGMRIQACSPGFIDGRNAILKADTIFFNAKYSCAIWAAFARRGLGTNASQGVSTNYLDGTTGFLSPSGISAYNYTADRTLAGASDPITYTSALTSGACAAANGYYIIDTIPTNATYLSGGTYDATNRVVKFTPVNIATGASQNYTLKLNVNSNAYYSPATYLTETVNTTTIPTATWTASSTVTATWGVSNARSKSASYSFFAADPSTVSDKILATTNAYTITGQTSLSFWHYFNLDAGYDGGVVEISTDGGTNWSDLGDYIIAYGYTSTIPTAYGSPIGGRKAFSGFSSTFIQTVVDLSSFSGKTVKFRFRLGTDNSVSGTGWYIDDIILKTEPVVINKSNLYNSSNQLVASNIVTTSVNAVALPVVWGNFLVQKQGNVAALLQWKTMQETNTSAFIVERSNDGKNFSAIANLPAAGNSTIVQNYSLKDASPLKGTNYYRILQKDKDGKSGYTDIRTLTFDQLENGLIVVTPNPAKDKIAITIPGNTELLSAKIINTLGQTVFAFTLNGQYSQQQLPLLSPGVYFIKINNNGQTVVKKVIIE